jgi:hypothetical protein
MATLKLCMMVHVETGDDYEIDSCAKIGKLASAIGTPYGAKLSVQFGRTFLDTCNPVDTPYAPDVPTSLSMVLEWGGNFWSHTHNTDANFLRSTHACVVSAYVNENSVHNMDMGSPMGRSGGWDSEGDADWVSITQGVGLGLQYMNSAVMGTHGNVPTTLRQGAARAAGRERARPARRGSMSTKLTAHLAGSEGPPT